MEAVAGDDRSLGADLARYVLTGEAQSSLGRLSGYHAAWQLGVIGHAMDPSPGREALRQFVCELSELPMEVLVRWARLLGAALAMTPEYTPRDMAGQPLWVGALLFQLGNVVPFNWDSADARIDAFSHERFEELLVAEGLEPAAMLLIAFEIPITRTGWFPEYRAATVRALAGYDEAVRRHADAVRSGLTLDKIAHQQSALAMMRRLSVETLQRLAAQIACIAVSANRDVRTAAQPLLAIEGVTSELRRLAEKGNPEQRLQALKLLWATDDEGQRRWAEERAAADRAAGVRKLLDAWTTTSRTADELPPLDLPPVSLSVTLTQDQRDRLHSLTTEDLRSYVGNTTHLPKLTADDVGQILRTLETGQMFPLPEPHGAVPWHWVDWVLGKHLEEFGPVVSTLVLARAGLLTTRVGSLTDPAAQTYERLFRAIGRPTLIELALILDAVGLDGRAMVADRYKRSYNALGADWPDDAVAPFVQHALPRFLDMVETTGDWYADDDAPFRALAALPALPPEAVDRLAAVALGNRKTLRRTAQDALARVDGIEGRIIAALTDGKAEIRAIAAQWLERLRYQPAVPALETAVGKEKNDVTKGALLDALQSLGQPVEKYIDRDGLLKQAESGLAKGLPKGVEWLRWDALPAVHWADTGNQVPPAVLKWLICQAVKAKSPEPNALLRKYCGLFVPGEREELGQFLLESWLAQDVAPVTMDEARGLAEQQASWWHQHLTNYPQYNQNSPMLGMSRQEIIAHLLPGFSRQPAGSAIAAKGVLAVVAACAGERAAAPVGRYLKEWYGTRASQGKSLIAMLAWIEHPSATQLMLSVGSRFRTKSFQEEAARQAAALAERKGWTINELADRSVPVAGFDPDGRIELSYGDRAFTAVLQPDLTVELLSPEGKKIKALPAARQTDDEGAVKVAKKALSTVKRELKSVVQLQSDRLYEALCTERTWPLEDWQRYLNEHPIVRRLVQRLAWIADGKVVFRPLEDGTLTDADDEPVQLADDAVVAVAHDTLLDEETVRSWQQHFDDYEVVPLFQQFGKGIFRLPPERSDAVVLDDFEGFLLETFALRGRAGKLGYTRGEPEDGGWFSAYEKRFPTLGVTIVVGFTGNTLPEENRTAALRSVQIRQTPPNGAGPSTPRKLGDVPAVLLSEAYNDIRLMASDGPGYDPDWEKKSEY